VVGLSEEVCLDMAREGRFRLEDPVGREARDAADIVKGFLSCAIYVDG
jgi:hypothetical protein